MRTWVGGSKPGGCIAPPPPRAKWSRSPVRCPVPRKRPGVTGTCGWLPSSPEPAQPSLPPLALSPLTATPLIALPAAAPLTRVLVPFAPTFITAGCTEELGFRRGSALVRGPAGARGAGGAAAAEEEEEGSEMVSGNKWRGSSGRCTSASRLRACDRMWGGVGWGQNLMSLNWCLAAAGWTAAPDGPLLAA